MRIWEDAHPNRPTLRTALIFSLAVAVVCLALIWFGGGRAGAWEGGCYEGDDDCTTIPMTDPTTTIPVVTTAPFVTNPCPGSGCPQPTVNTTIATTTTVAATTTTAPPPTDAADQTLPGNPAVVTVAPAAAAASSDTLPVTGGDSAWLFVLGGCLVALGLLIIAWTRPA